MELAIETMPLYVFDIFRSGEYSVVGRSVIIHADCDDLGEGGHALSSTTGNAGARVACGEIRKLKSVS